jgi:adenylate cyclase
MFLNFGVRGRLLFSFFGISLLTIFVSGAALYSFSTFGLLLQRITQDRLPAVVNATEVSRQAERIVAAAPSLLVAETASERSKTSLVIFDEVKQLNELVAGLEAQSGSSGGADLLAPAVNNLSQNLLELDRLVAVRLEVAASKQELLAELASIDKAIQGALSPGIMVLDAKFSRLKRRAGEDFLTALQQRVLLGELLDLVAGALPLQTAQFEAASINDMLVFTALANNKDDIEALAFPVRRSQRTLENLLDDLEVKYKDKISPELARLSALIAGEDALPETRIRELELSEQGRALINRNSELSALLTVIVDGVVAREGQKITAITNDAREAQRIGSWIIIAVTALSLLSAGLVIRFYVSGNLLARIKALSDSMIAIAGGNLQTPLPSMSDSDEIAQMASALKVFRDTAVEVQESNLQEIETTRRRLIDAIENSSEGFAFYDRDGSLVICNSRYSNLLFPDGELKIVPGLNFETVVRESAKIGLVADAIDRESEWVQEQIAWHKKPGEPRLQANTNGQWILITERKTGDGGTVAIYSDISDLKSREAELSKKSEALENLSKQLSKYLSPQIYESIFSGKQEVKLVSQRKRLTVFFSDLVGFTETTERLESEDLTRLLNQYLTEMTNIAIAYGATVDKYIGDAIVIFFGDPDTLGVKEDAMQCVKMAVAMQKRMKELERVWQESGLEKPLRSRIGINTGLCTVGNFGSDERMDYTIIGGGVNLAARLESACKPGEILLSYETYAHVKNVVECSERDQINVKGIAAPVTTFQVVDLIENLTEINRPIRADLPHFRLDLNAGKLSAEDRAQAIDVLRRAADRLSDK